jgi:hypothetical protein
MRRAGCAHNTDSRPATPWYGHRSLRPSDGPGCANSATTPSGVCGARHLWVAAHRFVRDPIRVRAPARLPPVSSSGTPAGSCRRGSPLPATNGCTSGRTKRDRHGTSTTPFDATSRRRCGVRRSRFSSGAIRVRCLARLRRGCWLPIRLGSDRRDTHARALFDRTAPRATRGPGPSGTSIRCASPNRS